MTKTEAFLIGKYCFAEVKNKIREDGMKILTDIGYKAILIVVTITV